MAFGLVILFYINGTYASPLQTQPVAPVWRALGEGVYVVQGKNQDVMQSNAARVVNTGVVDTGNGVLIIDPGPTYLWGMEVNKLVALHLHKKIRWVVNTHAHPENVLANSAFVGVPIYASQTTSQLMRKRCKACLARLSQTVGKSGMRGTKIVLPNHNLKDGQRLKLGNAIFDIRVFTQAHSYGDTTLFNVNSHTLFAGGLVYKDRLPEMFEADIDGWLNALNELKKLPIQTIVGAGMGSGDEALLATETYLQTLRRAVWRRLEAGEDESIAASALQLTEWQHWHGYGSRHMLNVQHVWLQLEKQWLGKLEH